MIVNRVHTLGISLNCGMKIYVIDGNIWKKVFFCIIIVIIINKPSQITRSELFGTSLGLYNYNKKMSVMSNSKPAN